MNQITIPQKARPTLRPDLPPLPLQMKRLHVDKRGFPVPYFVQWLDNGKPVRDGEGEPDFRIVNTVKLVQCMKRSLCWICGGPMGVNRVFVIGPMCAVNRVTSEPPSHRSCAEYAARACPFLTKPRMRRNEKDMPPNHEPPGGVMIARNPGVTLLWVTRSYKPFQADNGVLFRIGPAEATEWYAEGRAATRAEILESIATGLPALEAACDEELPSERERARWLLKGQVAAAMELLPP